jgi:hypothetical protein
VKNDLLHPSSVAEFFSYHRIEGLEKKLRDTFGGDGLNDQGFEKLWVIFQKGFTLRIRLGEKTGVIQIFINPGFEKTQTTKVDDKASLVELFTSKLDFNRPVMSVNKSTTPFVPKLTVSERDIGKDFTARKHEHREIDEALVSSQGTFLINSKK